MMSNKCPKAAYRQQVSAGIPAGSTDVEELLRQQSLLNSLADRLKGKSEGDGLAVGTDGRGGRTNLEGDNELRDIEALPTDGTDEEALALFETIRGVVSTGATDRSLAGHLRVILEVFLRLVGVSTASTDRGSEMVPSPQVSRKVAALVRILELLFQCDDGSCVHMLRVDSTLYRSFVICTQAALEVRGGTDEGKMLHLLREVHLEQSGIAEGASDSDGEAEKSKDSPQSQRIAKNKCSSSVEGTDASLTSSAAPPSNFYPPSVGLDLLIRSTKSASRKISRVAQSLLLRLAEASQLDLLLVESALGDGSTRGLDTFSLEKSCRNSSNSQPTLSPASQKEKAMTFQKLLVKACRMELRSYAAKDDIKHSTQSQRKSQKQAHMQALEAAQSAASTETETVKRKRFVRFMGLLLSRFPFEEQVPFLMNDMLTNLAGTSVTGSLRRAGLPALVLKSAGSYFRNYATQYSTGHCEAAVVEILDQTSWGTLCKAVQGLVGLSLGGGSAELAATTIASVFDGLLRLVLSVNAIEDAAQRISRHAEVAEILAFALDSPQSNFRILLTEADPTVQTAVLQGWKLFLPVCVQESFFFYPAVLKCFSFLIGDSNKVGWGVTFDSLHAIFSSFQELGIQLYNACSPVTSPSLHSHAVASLPAFASLVAAIDSRMKAKSPSNVERYKNDVTSRLSAMVDGESFGVWYRRFSNLFFGSLFKPLVGQLASLLQEIEEPSSEALAIMGMALPIEETTLGQLKAEEASLYRSQLRGCVGTCFRVFGCRSILQFPSLTLQKLLHVPLTSPSFAYDSNSWVLPLLKRHICRDELIYFKEEMLALVRELKNRGAKAALEESGTVGEVAVRHYRRLVDQVWALFPSFCNEPLDISVSALGDLVAPLVAALNDCATREAVCAGLGLLARQTRASLKSKDTFEAFDDDCESWRSSPVMDLMAPHCEAALAHSSDKFVGLLAMRYLQLFQKKSPQPPTLSEQSARNRDGQAIISAVRALSHFCPSAVLSKQLTSFSSAWMSAVEKAAALVCNEPSPCTNSATNGPSLSANECGALVDVVDALIPRLSENLIDNLATTFARLLQSTTEGLRKSQSPNLATPQKPNRGTGQTLTLSPTSATGNSVGETAVTKRITLVPSSSRRSEQASSKQLLQHLQRRAYKALKHICLRLMEVSCCTTFKDSKLTAEFWQIITDARTVSVCSVKARMGFLRSFIRLLNKNLASVMEEASAPSDHTYAELVEGVYRGVTPEILLCISEPNKATRESALDLMRTMADPKVSSSDHAQGAQERLRRFVHLLLPGLAGRSPAMQSSTVIALSSLVSSYWDRLPEGTLLKEIAPLLTTLARTEDKFVFRCCLGFFKVSMSRLPDTEEAVKEVGHILSVLLESPHALTCRMLIRKIVERAVKKFSGQRLQEIFPDAHKALLVYVDRALHKRQQSQSRRRAESGSENDSDGDERASRKSLPRRGGKPSRNKLQRADRMFQGGREGAGANFDSDEGGDDDESGIFSEIDEDNSMEARKGRQRAEDTKMQSSSSSSSGFHNEPFSNLKSLLDAFEADSDGESNRRGHETRQSGKKRRVPGTVLIDRASGNFDLLDPDAMRSTVLSVESSAAKYGKMGKQNSVKRLKVATGSGASDGVRMGPDGRLIVEEEDGTGGFGPLKPHLPNTVNPFDPSHSKNSSNSKMGGRKTLSDLRSRREALKKGKSVMKRGHVIQKSADAFKAPKARGDISKSGGVSPYAYIRLNPKMVKEKYRSEALKTFAENARLKGSKAGKRKGRK